MSKDYAESVSGLPSIITLHKRWVPLLSSSLLRLLLSKRREMRTKPSRHLSQKIEDLVSVDGQLLSLTSVVREPNWPENKSHAHPSLRQVGGQGVGMHEVKQNSKANHARKVKQTDFQWGRGDSNSHASRHMGLSHACLPVPALPQAQRNVIFYHFAVWTA